MNHAAECSDVEQPVAAVRCCTTDGRSCQSMCVSPITHVPYDQSDGGGDTGLAVDLATAEQSCASIDRRLCSRRELASGVCCGTGCGFDDARVWALDDCTLPSALTPIRSLPLRGERLRVSVNGQ